MRSADQLALYDEDGRRKYLCASELPRFLTAARRADAATCAFCYLLAYTGCRLSEALALTPARLDAETGRVVFRTLKRRRQVFRAVPVPSNLIGELCAVAKNRPPDAPIWRWSRQTAWRRVKSVMDAAGIAGAQAMPKG
jgi:integrase